MVTTGVLPGLRSHVVGAGRREPARDGAAWLRSAYCGLRGHDLLIHFETDRLCLKCADCGYETTGWRIEHGRARGSDNGTRRTR
jgi:hypothetical protein